MPLYRKGQVFGAKPPIQPQSMPPPKQPDAPADFGVFNYRLGAVEALATSTNGAVLDLRDKFVEFTATMKAATPCPAPGKCLQLDKELESVRKDITEIRETVIYAKGAIWGIGALGGLIGGVVAFAATVALKFFVGK